MIKLTIQKQAIRDGGYKQSFNDNDVIQISFDSDPVVECEIFNDNMNTNVSFL